MATTLIIDTGNYMAIIYDSSRIENEFINHDVISNVFMYEDTAENRYVLAQGSTIVGEFPFSETTVLFELIGPPILKK